MTQSNKASSLYKYLIYSHNHDGHSSGAVVYDEAIVVGQANIVPMFELWNDSSFQFNEFDGFGLCLEHFRDERVSQTPDLNTVFRAAFALTLLNARHYSLHERSNGDRMPGKPRAFPPLQGWWLAERLNRYRRLRRLLFNSLGELHTFCTHGLFLLGL